MTVFDRTRLTGLSQNILNFKGSQQWLLFVRRRREEYMARKKLKKGMNVFTQFLLVGRRAAMYTLYYDE
jgi:hypothetical protein